VKNPTLHDVAQLAGVSYATADRVLNRRGNVATKSIIKIENAVAQLGYVRNVAAANLSKKRTCRFCFVLPKSSNLFFDKMHSQLEKAQPHLKSAQVQVDVLEIDAFNLTALKKAIQSINGIPYDGVAIVGLSNAALEKPLKTLRESNMRIVSLVSDLPNDFRDFYIGINNRKAGRSAARLVGMAHGSFDGQLIILAGSMDAVDHSDRIEGFIEVLNEDYKNLSIAQIIETNDKPNKAYTLLSNALKQDKTITGIYNVGAGNDGVIKALETFKRPELFISCTHELDCATRQALQNGIIDVTIDQNPVAELNRAISLLQALANDLPPPPLPELVPAIHVRDNLPDSSLDYIK